MLIDIVDFIDTDFIKNILFSLFKIIVGLIILWLVFKFVNILSKKIETKLNKNEKIDPTISKFITPLLRKILKFFAIVFYIGYIGIETSSIAAAITSIGLAIGLAMQGSFSNFAGGFIILIMRPFKVGSYINVCGESGTVESIQIFYTTLITTDNRVIKIPNGEVANSLIIDINCKPTRRVDLTFPISHNSDLKKAKEIIGECIINTKLALIEPSKPFVNVNSSTSNCVEIIVMVWVKTKDYWNMYFKLLDEVKMSFTLNNIEMPTSKFDVNILKS